MNQKGQAAFVIPFLAISVLMLVLYAFIAPVLIAFNVGILEASDSLITDANASAANITNPEIQTRLTTSLSSAQGSVADQVDVLSEFFKYGWILLIAVIVISYLILTRRQVQQEQQFY